MNKAEIINYAIANIPGFMSEKDLDALYDLTQEYVKPDGIAVEVGSWKGLSSYVIASVCKEKGATLYAVDTWAGVEDPSSYKNDPSGVNNYSEALNDPNFVEIFKKNMGDLPVVVLKGDSQQLYKEFIDDSVDMVFLDGNHNSPVIDNDIKNFLGKIRPKGLLCGHDHGNPETDVHWAIDRILGEQTVGNYENWDLYASPTVIRSQTTIWCHQK
jgi:hypothetical protein